MGLYVNPQNGSKQEWLATNGEKIVTSEALGLYDKIISEGNVPVVLVNNGPFDALVVAYSSDELKSFIGDTNDHRPKQVWTVPVSVLNEEAGISPSELKSYGISEVSAMRI